ncbi:bifunctional hydroxymethylpyrimidine kinase/phosphomethylpyrimidine kinase [Candidatus Woesearchaeota archaeon]|nr:bifunctional hydroxymethylpyrimidine kinase/phosphomethylpyrimidine kinase [Candidatus Woesearchaeota archaeon]
MQKFIELFTSKRVLVIGDFMIDRYVYGDVTRISPEAPVPVLNFASTKDVLGGAGNTAANLSTLGAQVFVIGLTGADEDRNVMLNLLTALNVQTHGMIADKYRHTTVKCRYVSQGHQLLRMDRESTTSTAGDVEKHIIQKIQDIIPLADAVVVSDYAKGILTPAIAAAIRELSRQHAKPIIADIKPKNKTLATGFTAIKPNLKEAKEMSSKNTPEEIAIDLSQQFNSSIVLTMGKDGMLVYNKTKAERIAAQAKQVFDVTGAGDTVTAALALSLAAGAELFTAAQIANAAASVVVQKQGTATVSARELQDAASSL